MSKRRINLTPVGELIREKLDERGMTQAELSELTSISAPRLSDYLGGRRVLSGAAIVVIAVVLGLDAYELGRKQSDYYVTKAMNPALAQLKEELSE